MSSDRELLLQYARQGGEAEFAELVRRHADLVYSVALRVTCNSALAQDVTQVVFTQLACQAGQLGNYNSLVGWLHTAARRRAIDAVRTEERRRTREHEATAMQLNSITPETNWAEISPLLDEAVGQLREQDREAVLLRFFKNLSHQEVGAALGLGEDAARKRVDRALEKLRELFAQRGVTTTSAVLTAAIGTNSIIAAPVGLVASVTTASLAGVGGATASGAFLVSLFTFFMSTKTKTILAAAAVLVLVATLSFKLGGMSQMSSPAPTAALAAAATQPSAPSIPKAAPSIVAVAQPVAKVVAPTAKPAPVVDTVLATQPTEATPSVSQSPELTGAMGDFVTLLESGDFVTAAETYLQLPPTISAKDFIAGLQKNPDFPNTIKMMKEATMAAQTTTPVYNDTGDLATYTISPPVDGKKLVRWKKIGAQWYVDAFE